jgi:aminoglycoside phosphotransferase (APT) family kinase protein
MAGWMLSEGLILADSAEIGQQAVANTAPELMQRLSGWLSARLLGTPSVEIRDVVEPTQGFSSRTILFTALWQEGSQVIERPLVARLQRDVAVPMLADVFHQYRVMRAIAGVSDVRTPKIDFAETDPTVLGTPFFLMDRIDGRVPSDFPSYHAEGWFADLTAADRNRSWWNGIVEMERLHRIDWRQFSFLSDGSESPPTAGYYLDAFVAHWFDWAAQGQSYPAVEESLKFLIANQPPVHQVGLVWNDARLGNTMFRTDLEVASLLDFEVASLGPPEIDLAHWMYLDDIFSLNFGIPRIDGIPDEAEAIAGFERTYGWKMPYFSYYQAVAALKILVLSIRDYSNDKKMAAPAALPEFLVDRLDMYVERYRSLL